MVDQLTNLHIKQFHISTTLLTISTVQQTLLRQFYTERCTFSHAKCKSLRM